MAKGFIIQYEAEQYKAEDFNHYVIKWSEEEPVAKIFEAVNNDADIIAEGVKPEFELVFRNLDQSTFENLLNLNQKIVTFITDQSTESRYIKQYDLYCECQPIQISNMIDLDAVQMKLKAQEVGSIIENKMFKKVIRNNADGISKAIRDHNNNILVYRM